MYRTRLFLGVFALFLFWVSFAVPAFSDDQVEPKKPDFTVIDNHVLAATEEVEKSIKDLVAYLMIPAKTDAGKARAIYRWITDNIAYDVDGLYSGNYGNQSIAQILRRRLAVCDGYSRIFMAMAAEAGLKARRITGYSKGYGVAGGGTIGNGPGHAWNAVEIDGKWQLIDTTWGAGYVNDYVFTKRFTPFYFMTPPDEFIFSHYPNDSQWQLLDKPLSADEFTALVKLKPKFFIYNMKLDSHVNGVVSTKGNLDISLSVPDDVVVMSTLYYSDGTKVGKGSTFAQREGKLYRVKISPPEDDDFRLLIFAKQKSEPGSLTMALEYVIRAFEIDAKKVMFFPKKFSSFDESGSTLYKPFNGNLVPGTDQDFSIRVPGAESVAVVAGSNWVFLKKGENNLYTGTVRVYGPKMNIYAQFPGQSNYSGLLEYESRRQSITITIGY